MNTNTRITAEDISSLKPNEVFVYGDNESGRHGAGAARLALDKFGAIWGQAGGLQGQSFGIPTKDKDVKYTLPLDRIKIYVDGFVEFAKSNPDKTFLVTQIGCGLAALKPEQVAPLFVNAMDVENIHLPAVFWNVLNKD